jgi:threonine/homoserine/homoserine lactone efflux protein
VVEVTESAAAPDLLLALATFCTVTLFTPGPNNLMLMASGLNYGFWRSLPHYWGVTLGFTFMVLLVGFGLGSVFSHVPALYTALKIIGAVYLLYLAWEIAHAGPIDEADSGDRGKPMTFLQAALFQWVNPKAWVMAVGAVSAYAGVATFPWNVLIIAGLFALIGCVSSGTWVLFGARLRPILTVPRAVRIFNATMAALLVASLWPILVDFLR